MSIEAAAAAESGFLSGNFLLAHGGLMLVSAFAAVTIGFDPLASAHHLAVGGFEAIMA